MSTFVLVHGAWQGGWCWRRVASILRESGHDVFTPTMTGLGERAHLLERNINLDTHIQDILGVLQCEELSDIVLCGHSYGGMVITGVADKAAEQIRSIVYLDALVPADGQNALDLLPLKAASNLKEKAITEGSGFRVAPNQAEAFDVNAQDRDWVDRRCVDHPFNSLVQPIRLTNKWQLVGKYTYIYATGWSPGVGKTFFKRAQQDSGWKAIALDCGHDVMVDMPQEIADILIASI